MLLLACGDAPSASATVTSALATTDVPALTCTPVANVVTWTNGNVSVGYDLSKGTASFSYGGVKKISSFYAGVAAPKYVTSNSSEYTRHTCQISGQEALVTSTGAGVPTLVQSFVFDGGDHFLARVTVEGTGLSTNWIAPVVMSTSGGLDVGSHGDVRALRVPYDNDDWITYNAESIDTSDTSYEVGAFYDNVSRNGIVVGSVTHDTWKTGVYFSGSSDKLNALNVFGGATSSTFTHDVLPHGQVSGGSIASPLVFVGYAPDWRSLLEEYAAANVAQQPALPWTGGVPFGWNSWGTLKTKVTYDAAVGASDFIKSDLQNAGFSDNGVVYVNLDSYWTNLTSAQLSEFVAHCNANGQKAGIYWTPFVDWGKTATRTVEGTTYVYSDIWLQDGSGNPISVDGAYAVDPTHPGTKGRVDYYIDMFKSMGFEYVKLDFLSHGALESSVRFDPSVQTGVQAFNQGMQYVVDRIAGTMFISESIAPLFPYGYGHGRRVSCDTFGAAIGSMGANYEMNSATYGWWMSGTLYPFNDPDEIVLQGYTADDNMTRLVSVLVSGTVFLDGDDLTNATAQSLAKTMLTNGRMNAVARLGRAFRPVEGNTGTGPGDLFVLQDGGTFYLAVFNFTTSTVTQSVSLARAGLNGGQSYSVTDLWTGATSTAKGTMPVSLPGGYARLFSLTWQ
ncbi:MAG: alpha-galactosidase [Polyangiaceae bacterium]